MMHLTVINPFGNYARGAHITDADEVAAILAGPNAQNVVQRIPHDVHVSGEFYGKVEEAPAAAPVAAPSVSRFSSTRED